MFTHRTRQHIRLLFNDQKNFEVATLVKSTNFVAGEQGPEINVMPLMQMPQARVNTFSIGAYDQESGRNNLVFAWASSVEMGGDSRSWHRNHLMNGNDHGMTLNQATGAITWDTTGKTKGFYNIGVKVTDQSSSWALVDFIVEVTDPIERFCSAACPVVAGASCAGATSTYDPCASSVCAVAGIPSSCTADSAFSSRADL